MKVSEENKNKISLILKYICFIFCLFISLYVVNYILRDKVECAYSSTFNNEPKDTIDVVFLGSSQVIVGVQPMELWNDYGIASYNLATSATNIPVTYYAAKLAIEKQHPKLLVVDMAFLDSNTKHLGTERVHQLLDNFNFSYTKYEAIDDLIESDKKFEMIFPLYIYHTRWKSLYKNDFIPLDDMGLKGSAINSKVYPMTFDKSTLEVLDTGEINEVALEYTQKLIDLCKKENVELLFIVIPTVISNQKENMLLFNQMEEIAKKNSIKFLNGYKDEKLWNLDYYTDFGDQAHVNVRGAIKITDIIGQYIIEKYQVPDRRNDASYNSWEKNFIQYERYRDSLVNYPIYTLGTQLLFDLQWTVGGYFISGVRGPEEDGAWSAGKQSDAFFYIDSLSNKKQSIKLEVSNLFLTDTDSITIEVYINDYLVGKDEFFIDDIGKTVEFSIPTNNLYTDDLNHLTIKYPQVLEDDPAIAKIKWRSMIIE